MNQIVIYSGNASSNFRAPPLYTIERVLSPLDHFQPSNFSNSSIDILEFFKSVVSVALRSEI
jgi:hypothetical protein